MTAAPRALILPGYQHSGPEHWQSLWERRHPELTSGALPR